MTEVFTLSRDAFNKKCPKAFKDLWFDTDLSDVILATEDGGQLSHLFHFSPLMIMFYCDDEIFFLQQPKQLWKLSKLITNSTNKEKRKISKIPNKSWYENIRHIPYRKIPVYRDFAKIPYRTVPE